MKSTLTLAFTVLSAASFAQIPVSAFNFDGTLSPFVDKSAGYVFDLDFRQNGSPTTSIGSPNYVWDTVGPIGKMVAEFEIDKFFRAWHGMQANGGGSYVNQFTILLDVYFEKDSLSPTGWASLFNTTADNQNDGDSFIRWDGYDGSDVFGSIGISSVYWPTLYANRWNRIVIAVNCGATTGRTFLDYYVNGTFLGQTNASGGLDGLCIATTTATPPAMPSTFWPITTWSKPAARSAWSPFTIASSPRPKRGASGGRAVSSSPATPTSTGPSISGTTRSCPPRSIVP